jgi:hypothetical protein
MGSLTKKDEVLLREYAEAGHLCRSYEQLSRTSVAIFLPFSTAVSGFVLQNPSNNTTNLFLSLIGFIVTILTLSVLYRVREFYHTTKTRAVEIEKMFKMSLYARIDTALKNDKITPPNKIAFLWAVGLFAPLFFVLLVREVCRVYAS